MDDEIILTRQEYATLAFFARRGTRLTDSIVDPLSSTALEKFLKSIDRANNVKRYTLYIRWKELNSAIPPTNRFPQQWPPTLSTEITKVDEPVTEKDVQDKLNNLAQNPSMVMVTIDPALLSGWTLLEDYFK